MKTSIAKILVLAGSLLTGLMLTGQEPASPAAQETVSVANPASSQQVEAPAPAKLEAPAPAARKVEWKSDEARRRLGQGAAVDTARPEDSKSKAQRDGPPAWRLGVAFVVMIILFYGLYLFLKKYGRKLSGEETTGLKLVSRLRLDSRNSLALVQFHEEELLVSVNAAGGVQLLSKCAQIELAEDEGNAGKVDVNDSLSQEEDAIFDSHGIKTVKDGLI